MALVSPMVSAGKTKLDGHFTIKEMGIQGDFIGYKVNDIVVGKLTFNQYTAKIGLQLNLQEQTFNGIVKGYGKTIQITGNYLFENGQFFAVWHSTTYSGTLYGVF